MDTVPALLSEIFALHLRSFLVVYLTLSILEQRKVRIPNFKKELLKSILSVSGNLEALTAVLCETLTFQLKSFLVDFLTLSISEQKEVKIPNFEEELLRSRLSATENLDSLTAVLCVRYQLFRWSHFSWFSKLETFRNGVLIMRYLGYLWGKWGTYGVLLWPSYFMT